MTWKGQRSRISFRNLLRNKQTLIIAIVCCLAAVGAYAAYVGFHKPTSEAGELDPYKGVLNFDASKGSLEDADAKITLLNFYGNSDETPTEQIIDLSNKIGNKGDGGDHTWGSPTNPFVILEIVPWQGYSEMGYMVEGCEPQDIFTRAGVYDKKKAAYYRANGEEALYDSYDGTKGGIEWANMGSRITECFGDEDYPGKGTKEGDPDYKYRWFPKNGEKTIKGYYECVTGLGDGYEGNFSITGLDKDGRPVFEKDPNGDFVWVSLGSGPNYEFHQKKENKTFDAGASVEEVQKAYKAGDREYTSRTDTGYYAMTQTGYYAADDGKVYTDLIAKSKFVHYNDFLRYTLRLRNMKEVDDFCIVIKPIDPEVLNKNPKWLDYADLLWTHRRSESGMSNEHTKGMTELQTFNKDLLTTKYGDGAEFFKVDNSTSDAMINDITWEIAEKLFMKVNALAKYEYNKSGDVAKVVYDYTGAGDYGYAPIVFAKDIIDKLNTGQAHTNPTYYMDYMTMKIQKYVPSGVGNVATETKGMNNNFYKFCLMDLLMDQDIFYELFYRPLESTGQPIIQTQKVNGVDTGVSVAQEGDAQYFWCPATFLPYVEKIAQNYGWETEDGKKLKEKYGINQYGNAFMNFPGSAIVGYTYIYNSNNTIFVLGTSGNLDKDDDFTGGAFDWFEEERGEQHGDLSSLEIMDFLLNYKKGIRTGDTSREELKLRVLDVEPCSDYTYLTATALRALFPSTRYKISFKITHMTTAELNGNRDNLIANYDVIYVGTGTGKFNVKNEVVPVYNDSSNLEGAIYLHVGDKVSGDSRVTRTSGDDLTSIKGGEITDFAKTGKIVILDTPIYNDNTYNNRKVVSTNTNVSNMAKTLKSEKKSGKDNIVSLEELQVSDPWQEEDFLVGKAEVKMKSTPATYQNSVAAETGQNQTAAIKKDEDGKYRLSFTFTLGYEAVAEETYAAKLLVDRNGDGIISDNETGAAEIDTWDSESSSGSIFTPGSIKTPMLNENDEPMVDEDTGEEIFDEEPLEYTVSYVIPDDYENGAIAWKFVLYATKNKAICYEWSGVSRYTGYTGDSNTSIEVKDEDDGGKKKKLIRILQVAEDTSGQMNLENELKKSNLFGKYAKLEDYKFEITTISLDDYIKAFADANTTNSKYTENKNAIFSVKVGGKKTDYHYPIKYIYNYDLYLFSCGKKLEVADNSSGAVSFAAWLVDSGYPVVFTSDSVYYDSKSTDARDALKDSTGVSRFTASSGVALKYVDTPYNSNGDEYTSNVANMEFTYYNTFVNSNGSDKYKTYRNELWQDAKGKSEASVSKKDALKTTEGTQTNLGTVCVYPYTIDNNIDLTSTNAQDYQLNLENPSAAAWYCLGRTNSDGTNNSYYTISPNDASNNYYLYSVNNVFYCGIQLKEIPQDNVQEMQLFINTLIAASESAFVEPYVTVNSVYNRETKQNEVGPSKQNSGKPDAGLDYFWANASNNSNQIANEAIKAAGVQHFYQSMITVGEGSGKSFRYKLYQVPEDPDKDDTIIWQGSGFFDTDTDGDKKVSSGNMADDEDEDQQFEQRKMLKNSYFNSDNMSWSGTTKISADDLNAMKITDELRIYYHSSSETMAKNTITNQNANETKQYEMSSEDRLFEVGIAYNIYGGVATVYVPAISTEVEKDDPTQTHCLTYTREALEAYLKKAIGENNLTYDADGNVVFSDITIKISDGVPYTPKNLWGHQEYWDNGAYYIKDATNPVVMEAIEVYQLEEVAIDRKTAKSVVSTLTPQELYPSSTGSKIEGDTHRVYFTPYAGTDDDDDVLSLEIYFVRIDSNGNLIRTRLIETEKREKTDDKGKVVTDSDGKPIMEERTVYVPQPIVKVYKEKKDSDGKVTEYKEIANEDGVYSIENGGTLKSSTEYFLTYDKMRSNMDGFQFIEFEIFNDKTSSKTVLELEPNYSPTSEDVYLFNLD